MGNPALWDYSSSSHWRPTLHALSFYITSSLGAPSWIQGTMSSSDIWKDGTFLSKKEKVKMEGWWIIFSILNLRGTYYGIHFRLSLRITFIDWIFLFLFICFSAATSFTCPTPMFFSLAYIDKQIDCYIPLFYVDTEWITSFPPLFCWCLRGAFLEDAMVVSCGHSFGGLMLRRVLDMVSNFFLLFPTAYENMWDGEKN